MLRRLLRHARANAVAYLALFVALGGTGAYAANTIGSSDIIDGQVKYDDLANNSIGAAKIIDGHVIGKDLQDGAVTNAKLGDGSVTNAKIGDGSVTNAKLGFGSVTNDKLGYRSVATYNLPAPTRWHYFGQPGEPTLQSGWVNYDQRATPTDALFANAGYYVDLDGTVHLGGTIKNSKFVAAAPIVTLPRSLCPYYNRIFPVSSGNSIGRVTVGFETDNGCNVLADSGYATYLSLDGIGFRPYAADLSYSNLSPARARAARAARAPRR